MVDVDIFTIKDNTLFSIINNYDKLSVVKKTDGLSADSLIRVVKIVFAEFGLPKEMV